MKIRKLARLKGFTLIELLVVVLIIGILSAIALPQYEKAVWKSRAGQLQTLVRSLHTAQTSYYMANGTYAQGFDELDLSFGAFQPNAELQAMAGFGELRVKDNLYALFVEGYGTSGAMFVSGPYASNGFAIFLYDWGNIKPNVLYCAQVGNESNFCKKMYGGVEVANTGTYYYYSMP